MELSGAIGDGVAFGSARGRWVMAVTVLGSGMAFLDGTIVNVALPVVGRDLHASTGALQWILNGYLLTLASLILIGGSLGDRFGRRRVFVLGALLFTLASLLCALAPNVGTLVAARMVQGVGAAMLTPGSLAMIEAVFRPADRARAIGAWSGMAGVATALGPLVGGYLIGAVSWRAAFLLNLPIGAFVAIAARRVPETRDPMARGPLDGRGAVLAAVALGASTFALIQAGGTVGAAVVVSAVVAVAAGAAFIRTERHSRNPMLPLSIFSSRQFSAANLVTFIVYAALGGVFFLLVSFLEVALGYSPIQAGAATLPVTALMLGLSARGGALAQRIGPRIPLTVGPLVIAAAMLLMTRLAPGKHYVPDVLVPVVVFGLGLTLVVAPVTATVLAAADARHARGAPRVKNPRARVGGLLAVAVLPLVGGITGERFYDPVAMTHGFHVAMYVSAAVAGVGGLVAWQTISDDVLAAEPARHGAPAVEVASDFSCSVAGPPLRHPAS